MAARLPLAITHAPGHMLVCDLTDSELQTRKDLEELEAQQFKPPEILTSKLQSGLVHCSKQMAEAFLAQGSHLQGVEAEFAKAVPSLGTLEEQTTRHDEERRLFDMLKKNAAGMAEALNQEIPEMDEDNPAQVESDSSIFILRSSDLENIEGEEIFDSVETRLFYETLPTPPDLAGSRAVEEGSGRGGAAMSAESLAHIEVVGSEGKTDTEKLQGLLQQMHKGEIIGREACDEFSVQLCRLCSKSSHVDSKASRKAIYQALYPTPWWQEALVPSYARIAATLAQVMPEDFKQPLASHVQRDFSGMCSKKDQKKVESRLCNARMVGELTKFQIIPPIVALKCFKALLDDFSHLNIDVTAVLMDSVGRFLYCNPATSLRMRNVIDIIMKLKASKNLDPRQEHLIENAYYTCMPPNQVAKTYTGTPLQEYIRDLVFQQLTPTSLNHIAGQLQKMQWDDHKNVAFLVYTMLAVTHGRYSQIPVVAKLASRVRRYRTDFPIFLVDAALEEIRCGLETNSAFSMQARVAQVRLLGELAVCHLCPISVVLDTLYLIISFGNIGDVHVSEAFDPPMNYCRIRLAVNLLEVVTSKSPILLKEGEFHRFLLHFHFYTLQKGKLPVDLRHSVRSIYSRHWPYKLQSLPVTVVSAAAAIQDFEQKTAEVYKEHLMDREAGDAFDPTSNILEGFEDEDVEEGSEGTGDGIEGSASRSEECASSEEDYESSDSEDFDEFDDDFDSNDSLSGDSDSEEMPTEEEVADFDRHLKNLMKDSLGAAKLQPVVVNMAAAPTMPFVKAANTEPCSREGETLGPSGNEAVQPSMRFQFMAKRGGKPFTRELKVPLDNKIALATQNREAEVAEERSEIKRFVLKASLQQEKDENALVGTVFLLNAHKNKYDRNN